MSDDEYESDYEESVGRCTRYRIACASKCRKCMDPHMWKRKLNPIGHNKHGHCTFLGMTPLNW
eukprot:CAMPEP_0177653772 /NCGR_PEP_ID=MMETSP0447-20121125/13930_1 /TAXON_ID=0 /ORGANISM="Stygamoeba regulata, Strain BSH-02190019" /LENGTH=62 /DNA_ID=CAMNT_0019157283 /DNA_START=50 /DNA_END=235 /DNA_ORIENTATION=-